MQKNLFFFLVSIVSALILLPCLAVSTEAAGIPTPDSVLESYKQNPYIRFYEGSQGIAWTTIHPGGYSVNAHGAYIYGGGTSVYRGIAGTEVFPSGVTSRKELQGPLPAGHHYYSAPLNNTVIPVGKWVLSHVDAACVHGPFEACRDYEYYGVSGLGNAKCLEEYDSGWIAYCADCGERITGYVYASDDCIKRLNYIFAGDEEFRLKYPAEYMFICPICGDNLENDIHMVSHNCKCFISPNRYRIVYDGNGATAGSMDPSICYYGGADEYEGISVSGDKKLKENVFEKTGYVFVGWSDTPMGQVVLCNGATSSSVENYFTFLSGSGDDSNDKEVKLYAVWKKTDSTLDISGGVFGDSAGSYNGVENSFFTTDKNSFYKGYMSETEVRSSLLGTPHGYRIKLVIPGGSSMPDIFASSELTGWVFESEDPDAYSFYLKEGDISVTGKLSGMIYGLSSDGSFVYVHSSLDNNNYDHVTALWKSTSVILPDAVFQGMVFDGWYTDPNCNPDTYVGKDGDIFMPECDTTLYAGFSGLNLIASPDYMGNDEFGALRYNGLTDLIIPASTEYDIYRYFITSDYPDCNWVPAFTDDKDVYELGNTIVYSDGGKYSEYTASVSGIYTFDLWGGAGASYGQYKGENGEYSSCKVFLNKGDVVGIYTGSAGGVKTTSSGTDCGGGEGSYITINGDLFMSCAGGKGASYVLNIKKEFNYTGSVQTFTVTDEGDYTFEVWGASGSPDTDGRETYGLGGYARGNVHLTSGSVLYICVGGKNGYNGGGSGGSDAWGGHGGNGGGATHIASVNGQLRSLGTRKKNIYIVAGGGGGGGGSNASSGSGGGTSGGSGISPWPDGEGESTGGNQTVAGYDGYEDITYGGFGYGGNGISYDWKDGHSAMVHNGGGGAGWYGGGGGGIRKKSYGCGGGGGSGYIGGVTGGRMSNGVRNGNGYALITCSVNIKGKDATGEGTAFYPGDMLYAGHTVKSHSECVYPSGDTSKCGYCIITEPSEQLYLSSECKVYSPDTAVPNAIEDANIIYDRMTGSVSVVWNMPCDNGTDYHYIARAYSSTDLFSGISDRYASTNIEALTITTGVYSYSYLIDSTPHRNASYVKSNGSIVMSAWSWISGTSSGAEFVSWYENASAEIIKTSISFIPDGTDRYIHIIVTDRAGNDSAVFDMPVDGENAHIPYPLFTEELNISPAPNVYPDPERARTYYVRADGKTEFSLEYAAYIDGYARTTYQIDTTRFHLSGSEYSEVTFENNPVFAEDCEAVLSDVYTFGPFPLHTIGITDASRTDKGTRISFAGAFTTMSEEGMYIYPSAHAHLESGWDIYGLDDGLVSSEKVSDMMHGLTLIGDGTAPECMVSVNGSGYQKLALCNISNVSSGYVVDRRYEDVNIDLYVTDSVSGLKDGFSVCITNLDNGLEARYSSTGEHFYIALKQDPDSEEPSFDNMLFNGRFIISVSSEDNVGNTGTVESSGLDELDVNGEIVRTLDEITGPLVDEEGRRYIKNGESGYVISRVWGYPDVVLVSFDDKSLREYDVLYVTGGSLPKEYEDFTGTVIYVDSPEYFIENRTDFTVPLDYDNDEIRVTITGFKDGKEVVWETQCMVISSGSVLDELMTVLR